MSFAAFGLHSDIVRGATALGFTEPTPIQTDAIPPARDGRDVLAAAMTGSGKTAAFVLPILQRLAGRPRGVTRVLVLAPTRELAAQIDEQRRLLGRFTRVSGAAVFGGVGMGPQEAAFRRGVDILVATPGRLLDHLQYPYARLDGIEILVLDEADRMLDMGFLPDIRRILARLPRGSRQTMLFSATMPPAIVSLARELLRDPVAIDVERPAAPAVGVTHAAYAVASDRKLPLLVELLRQPGVKNALVFTRTKHRADRLAAGLVRRGVVAERIHGNRSQAQRTQALAAFKAGTVPVLVATDIAARGIDVTGLSHVVNFDVPHVADDYIHRVGRTARAEAVGDAVTLVSPEEEADFRAIERAVGGRIARMRLPGFDYAAPATERLEVPLAERIAAIRARKAEDRARARVNAERRARAAASPGRRPATVSGR
jgi:ATP-dependent RNA helicase RhlE